MHRSRNEHTTAVTCMIHGRGYWSGQAVTVTVHPAPMGTGICMVRTDLDSRPQCVANVSHREDASLRTNLVCGDARFQMVEHLMAALAALEIDNAIVEIDREELPSLDGSSLAFVEQLSRAGLVIQARPKQRLIVHDRYRVGSSSGWVEAMPSKHGETYYEYQLSYDDETPIAPQAFGIELTPDRFIREIAPARTFVTAEQAEQIRATGLASHVTNQDLLVIDETGPIENSFRFANECARHKTLDMIGDLALTGVEIVGRFTSFRGGHNLNGRMAAQLHKLAIEQASRQSQQMADAKSQNTRRAKLTNTGIERRDAA
ncbi:UDP-3-O-acyl-N-acetylglucosamine deacetylase [Rubripirellula tenax]|uniref:UDP-3-O-acyl-N-acetylglucosamine deacetylase n=1 Tax=Rubripirellula tenax TaxID=2528015 RepID=UPI0011B6A424|nr:UDP-3-O-acyl-N-acetylglucosamine deacetylase [Rubripirellula tenax]